MRNQGFRASLIAAVSLAAACSSSHPAAANSSHSSSAATGATTATTPAVSDVTSSTSLKGVVYVADNGGRVWAVKIATGKKFVISTNAKSKKAGGQALMQDLYGISREADGNLVVTARRGTQEDKATGPHSRIIRINPHTGAQSLILSSPKMHYGLVSLKVGPTGEIYYGDEATTDGNYNAGAVWGVDPKTHALHLVADDNKSVKAGGVDRIISPLGIAFESAKIMYVLADNGGDEKAPNQSEFIGSILRVRLPSGKMTLVTSNYDSKKAGGKALFHDPRSFVRAPNGDFYIVDDARVNDDSYSGDDTSVIKVNHITGAQSLVSNNARSAAAGGKRLFSLPYGIAMQPDGQLLVADRDRLLRVNPTTGAQSVVTSGLGNAIALSF